MERIFKNIELFILSMLHALKIKGGNPLRGDIEISGAKNAALPLIASVLLSRSKITFSNMPQLSDIAFFQDLLGQMGVKIKKISDNTVSFDAGDLTSTIAPYDLVRKMRASILVLGPLLAREGKATVSLPGGCAIGTRPVDLHIEGLKKLGADIEIKEGYIHAAAPNGLTGAHIAFPIVTVTGTANILMAATLAKGVTTITNAAKEPEIGDLIECLQKMGAKIEGIGTDTLTIEGVSSLTGCEHEVISDRIEAGTFAVAAVMTKGALRLRKTKAALLSTALDILKTCGAKIEIHDDGFSVSMDEGIQPHDINTEPYPGFPTDLQAQFMALMSVAKGTSVVTENIFENRFMHVPELNRMGTNISVSGKSAIVRGVNTLKGAPVMATDLRASVSLILAALVAEGETIVNRIYHLDRGYEKIEEKLKKVGATVDRIQA